MTGTVNSSPLNNSSLAARQRSFCDEPTDQEIELRIRGSDHLVSQESGANCIPRDLDDTDFENVVRGMLAVYLLFTSVMLLNMLIAVFRYVFFFDEAFCMG